MDTDAERIWSDVDDYFNGALVPPDAALEAALAGCESAGLPSISVTPAQGKFLGILARSIGARSILELGTLGGYSTIWLARTLAPGGRLVTLERDPHHAEVARSNIARAGLADVVDVRIGDALVTLRDMVQHKAGPFDLVFIDADKQNIPSYFQSALELTAAGSLIIVDNVVREGEVIDADSRDESVIGVRAFIAALATTDGVSGTVIQTVGAKGYDGFAIVRVDRPRLAQ